MLYSTEGWRRPTGEERGRLWLLQTHHGLGGIPSAVPLTRATQKRPEEGTRRGSPTFQPGPSGRCRLLRNGCAAARAVCSKKRGQPAGLRAKEPSQRRRRRRTRTGCCHGAGPDESGHGAHRNLGVSREVLATLQQGFGDRAGAAHWRQRRRSGTKSIGTHEGGQDLEKIQCKKQGQVQRLNAERIEGSQ